MTRREKSSCLEPADEVSDGQPTGRSSHASLSLFARLIPDIRLEADPDGATVAVINGGAVPLGKFGPRAGRWAAELIIGAPLDAIAQAGADEAADLDRLLRRLARGGLLEYRLASSQKAADLVVIEPQLADYWPRMPELPADQPLVLSRFAFMRRRGDDMVLESPRSDALFRLCDPRLAALIAALGTERTIADLERDGASPPRALLALLFDCRILFTVPPERGHSLRMAEGDDNLVLWDFHDLLFHARSTGGRHANPLGGTFPYAHVIEPLPAVRPRWPGRSIDLRKLTAHGPRALSGVAALLRERHSVRDFDDRHPITLAELAQFLDGTARVHARERLALGEGLPATHIAARPYPSGGGSYELELYLAVDRCEGLARGFYHYDAGRHALVPIAVAPAQLDAMLAEGQYSMGAAAAPQILVTITARFGRVAWKYSAIAYALILKHVGVVMQTFYIMATGMRLGACAIGASDIDLFAKMTGIEFHIEGPVGQMALGRERRPAGKPARRRAGSRKR